jgi:membrane protein required for colicin V production
MNLLDILILAVCLGLTVIGIFQGLVRQAFSWSGLILGHLLGVNFYVSLKDLVGLSFQHADVVCYMLLFAGAYLLVRLAGILAERLIRESNLSGTDRFAGALAGLAKGILLSILMVFLLVILLPREASLVRGSKLAPRVAVAAGWISKIFPDRIGDVFREKIGETVPSSGKPAPSPLHPPSKKRPGK